MLSHTSLIRVKLGLDERVIAPVIFAILILLRSIADLTQALADISGNVSLVALGVAGLTWGIGSAIKGSPLHFRELKQHGTEMQMDAIKSVFWLSMYGALSSLVTYVVSVIALAAK